MGSIAPALLRRVLHTRPHDPGHLPFWEGHLVHGARAAPLLAATRPACTTGGLLAQEAQLTNGSRVSTRSGEHRPHCCSPALTAVHEEVHVVRRGARGRITAHVRVAGRLAALNQSLVMLTHKRETR